MPSFTYEDLAAATGTELGHSRWIDLDQHRIDTFAHITEDYQWIHVDPERGDDHRGISATRAASLSYGG